MIEIPLLAQIAADLSPAVITIGGAMLLVNLAIGIITLARSASGKSGERQVEPTQISEIRSELKTQTSTLNKLDREVGETKTSVEALGDTVERLAHAQADETDKMFRRINAISTESTDTKARVDGLERREARA